MNQKELESKIKHYQKAYYDGHEEISDDEFDKLWNELETNYPDSDLLKAVGEDSVSNNKIKHLMLMGSLSKFNTEEGLRDWVKKESIIFPVQVSNKIDGNSCELQYKDGKLLYAVTRGDAVYGEDITLKALGMPSIPNTIPTNDYLAIRGEIVMNKNVFESKYSSDFKNPRNLTAGLLKNEDFKDYGDLRFIAYDLHNEKCPEATEKGKLQTLELFGFEVVECVYCNSIKEILDYRETRSPRDREYALDGLVLKQNVVDINDMYEIRPRKQHAFKWIDISETTILRDVEWSMTGDTLTPVAIFDPVELEGTTVKRANLSNPSWIKRLNLHIGDTIRVVKRGQIIPKVEEVVAHNPDSSSIVYPDTCPICGGKLTLHKSRLTCDNPECNGRNAARIAKWFSVNDVKGFGPAFVKKLGACNLEDLYGESLRNDTIKEIGVNAVKAFEDLDKKTSKISLAKFIAGYNIDGIGIEIAQSLVDSGVTFEKLFSLQTSDLIKIPGWSDKRASDFLEGLKENEESMKELAKIIRIEETSTDSTSSISGLHICVTGSLDGFSRKEIADVIKSKGAFFDSSVTGNTDILITNDTSSGSSKLKKAEKLGVRIMSEKDFCEFAEII